MSQFSWEVIDASGRKKKGEIEAESERSARQALKRQGYIVRKIELLSKQSQQATREQAGALSSSDITLFLQQLATLTAAGMPLTEALESVAEGMDKKRSRRAVHDVRQQVVEGVSLARAMRSIGLDDIICNMVEAGEETGQLEAVAARLSELLDKRQQMKQELLSAILYPTIILSFGILVMIILLTFVVPQIVAVFERTGGELPTLTVIVISVSEFLRAHGLALILALAASALAVHMALRKESIRELRDNNLLRIPGIASMLAKIETARYTRTLGMLLGGGVPTLAAMHIANQSFASVPFRRLGEQAREAMREGGSLAESLKQGHVVPHLAVRLISVGEQSGKLDQMLLRIADQFDQETSRNLKRLLTIVEPALMLVMAIMVGMMAMAILMPIVEMNTMVH
ncbi:MAG: hypothetical protein CO186_10720 [Zetaproteobacteria bacterium CG_4_9_14_3_um_filter_49_83]|nr:MAG: hypothetical protein AUJ56_09540 [Zetaproteobacteria bacterium CG1_02_49_23]PIQ30692.1 MAG: hypothetical protein COW62_11675 [Zetaproteobacteria bacterium CG17_big_fil_post_rev_8_21_14_2_50_50_13]PIV29173.1 MAG: hypothetical protein COS35_13485 [Zetaproteobacteria bacterium CG02_land_8_20_14_3_00_50_9]PIY57183.1 MAG: hypothetical protein COZ00_00355 [Zetaproteobacteria bacterium CG_4_10_14_0_8_um_filter_49_80]PJA34458.1 MAG: hypothetical protein CO186_10720 [Zetaproteobacteria bacterium